MDAGFYSRTWAEFVLTQFVHRLAVKFRRRQNRLMLAPYIAVARAALHKSGDCMRASRHDRQLAWLSSARTRGAMSLSHQGREASRLTAPNEACPAGQTPSLDLSSGGLGSL